MLSLLDVLLSIDSITTMTLLQSIKLRGKHAEFGRRSALNRFDYNNDIAAINSIEWKTSNKLSLSYHEDDFGFDYNNDIVDLIKRKTSNKLNISDHEEALGRSTPLKYSDKEGGSSNNDVSKKDDKIRSIPFESYKKQTTVIVKRRRFIDVVCDALAEYKYVGPNQRAD
ncbi:hypothetical protein Tco_0895756 [Tanacetum coccineum]|uniref:Uncharacterized protein n=1 Tax=Tanacetum coccineum TaxID=301880 RepID=A0ABQ5CGQ1_9ASTR